MQSLADVLGSVLPPLLIVVGLLGIVIPVLPGLLLVLGGVLLWALLDGSGTAWGIFAASVLVAGAGWTLQYLIPGQRMREQGVRSSTLALAVLCAVVGFFAIPFVGAFVGFVLGIYVVEVARSRDRALAWTRTRHALVAVLHSVGIELVAGIVIAGLYSVGLVLT